MDGPFWIDTRAPHMVADVATVTLSTTFKAIVPASAMPVLGSNYFGYMGKAVRIRIWGDITTAATPGNMTAGILWGTGADNNGTVLGQSNATTLSANQALNQFVWDIFVRCRKLGSAGQLIAYGVFGVVPLTIASTLQPLMIPSGAQGPTTVDLTQNYVISPQIQRSGSTAETVTVHDFIYEAMN